MKVTQIISLGFSLASLATADEAQVLDGPALKAIFSTLGGNIDTIGKAVKAITADNVAAQMATVQKELETLSSGLVSGSETLKKSKALGIFDLTSLGPALAPLQKSSLSAFTDLVAKRPIIVKANAVDPLAAGFKKLQAGSDAMMSAMETQLPPALTGQIPKSADIPGFNLEFPKMTNLFVDVFMSIFKGGKATIDIDPSIWPMPAAPAKRAVEWKA